jgi:heme A synthase
VAIAVGFGVAYIAMRLAATTTDRTKRFGAIVGGLIVFQFFVGLSNVLLAAPLEIQIIHLAVADAAWIMYLIFSASLLGEKHASNQPVEKVA